MKLADIFTDCGALAFVAGIAWYDLKLGLVVGGGALFLLGILLTFGAKSK